LRIAIELSAREPLLGTAIRNIATP